MALGLSRYTQIDSIYGRMRETLTATDHPHALRLGREARLMLIDADVMFDGVGGKLAEILGITHRKYAELMVHLGRRDKANPGFEKAEKYEQKVLSGLSNISRSRYSDHGLNSDGLTSRNSYSVCDWSRQLDDPTAYADPLDRLYSVISSFEYFSRQYFHSTPARSYLIKDSYPTRSPNFINQGPVFPRRAMYPGASNFLRGGRTRNRMNMLRSMERAPTEHHFSVNAIHRLNPSYTWTNVSESILSTSHLAYFCQNPQLSSEKDYVLLKRLANVIVQNFIQSPIDTHGANRQFVEVDTVITVSSLAGVLEREDFRDLFQSLLSIAEKPYIENTLCAFEGLCRLIKGVPSWYIDAEDLVKVLDALRATLEYSLSLRGHGNFSNRKTEFGYLEALTVSRLMDSIVDSQAKGLKQRDLHEKLATYFNHQLSIKNPVFLYQAAYAYQAMLYASSDETILKATIIRSECPAQRISGVVNPMILPELEFIMDGLSNIQQELQTTIEVAKLFDEEQESGEDGRDTSFIECLENGLCFNQKSSWYPALRVLDILLEEGRLLDFENFAKSVPCHKEATFQLGLCQRLGDIAATSLYDLTTRRSALSFLDEIFGHGEKWGSRKEVKLRIIQMLHFLSDHIRDEIGGGARELGRDRSSWFNQKYPELFNETKNDNHAAYPIVTNIPSELNCSIKVAKSQMRSSVGDWLFTNFETHGERRSTYIPPRAATNVAGSGDFDLMTKVQEFIQSDKTVFLILGESGSGKTTFARTLENQLWERFAEGGPIPIFIDLLHYTHHSPSFVIQQMTKAMKEYRISEISKSILMMTHQFIFICDGFEETQPYENICEKFESGSPDKINYKMVFTCNSGYGDAFYDGYFRSVGINAEPPQIATICPFNDDQVHNYIQRYSDIIYMPGLGNSWSTDQYRECLQQIPGLKDLVRSPLLLKLAMDCLSRLDLTSDLSGLQLRRVQLFDGLLEKIPRGYTGFRGNRHQHIEYFKELSVAVYEKQDGKRAVSYSESELPTWKTEFFTKEKFSSVSYMIPLLRDGTKYQFTNKAVLEYGWTLAVFDHYLYEKNTTRQDNRDDDMEESLAASPLNERNIEEDSSILLFLVDRVLQYPDFKRGLQRIIFRSRNDESLSIAATNAEMILLLAGVSFNDDDDHQNQDPCE
ncbi:hypothetical protein BGZ76_010229 [Entomortierella beljakovae]|nr:hypothetical protein BGZ76_010229 [Entomortierella beljakovae]